MPTQPGQTLVVMVNSNAICHSYKPLATVFTWKFIVHETNNEGKWDVQLRESELQLAKTLATWFCCFFFSIQTVSGLVTIALDAFGGDI